MPRQPDVIDLISDELPIPSAPVEIQTLKYVQDYLFCPPEDRVYAVSKIFLDNMCPLDTSLELHSALTKLPVIMPCQIKCPRQLGEEAKNEDMLL